MPSIKFPRLTVWFIVSVALFLVALLVATHFPSNPVAVSLYKVHLMSIGGWGGYWLDRALFPYSRPHLFFDEAEHVLSEGAPSVATGEDHVQGILSGTLDSAEAAMLRRAIIVAACLICVGLGA